MQDGDIEIAYGDGSRMVKLTIRQSKTDQLGLKTTLFLSETEDLAYPVSLVSNFRAVRTQEYHTLGNFHFDGNPLTRYHFSSVLAKIVLVL